ncbi:MAG TPA: dephospho-CoA kinase [Ferruginibacter sp.]|nr:dephospho-CoA kinase [Ferruginibacter sp.]
MIKVGITGGIGSGKSTVAKVFETLGIPVFYADQRAKILMDENEALKEKIQQNFGKDIYVYGKLDKKHLSDMIFSDAKKLALLNSLVHPATIKDADDWMLQQTTPYAVKEAALIFESGAQKFLDYVIGVSAPAAIRIQRAIKRDNVTAEEVKARMNKQIDEDIKMKLCDFVIINDEQQLLIPQVLKIHQQLLMVNGKW